MNKIKPVQCYRLYRIHQDSGNNLYFEIKAGQPQPTASVLGIRGCKGIFCFTAINVVKLLPGIGMEGGSDIHYVIECASRSQCWLSGFQKQASLVFENQAPAFRLCDCLPA